jgi:hypothetical protein
MKTSPSGVEGISLVAPGSTEFETTLEVLLGAVPRDIVNPAIPFSVIVANDSSRAVAFLGVRFDMTGPLGKPYSVIHYADTLRTPDKADFRPGTKRFVCAEPSYTALLLRGHGDVDPHARLNLENLSKALDVRASIDSLAFDDGRFEGPDSLGAFERLARERDMESTLTQKVAAMSASRVSGMLLRAAEDRQDRARRALARKLLEGLEDGGREEMLKRALNHRFRISVWRQEKATAV